MRSKVCGMTSADQVMQLDEMGVEFAGFIFYPKYIPLNMFHHKKAFFVVTGEERNHR